MTDHSVKHSTFTLERTYAASPAVVFAAWSDADTKAKWFAAEDGRYSLDFRVGGTEAVHGGDGVDLVARSEYHDIADHRAIRPRRRRDPSGAHRTGHLPGRPGTARVA